MQSLSSDPLAARSGDPFMIISPKSGVSRDQQRGGRLVKQLELSTFYGADSSSLFSDRAKPSGQVSGGQAIP
jgi:hypothetical protein